jgi:hypothetical protein
MSYLEIKLLKRLMVRDEIIWGARNGLRLSGEGTEVQREWPVSNVAV